MTVKHNNLNGEIWNKEDDALLVEKVLERVRQGFSTIDACREVESITNGRRSASACKFRWHVKLKETYKDAYDIAKAEGKKNRDILKKKINQEERFDDIVENVLGTETEREIMIDDIMLLVKRFKQQEENKVIETEEINKLRRENEKLKKELKEAKEELASIKAKRIKVRKDKGLTYSIEPDGTIKL